MDFLNTIQTIAVFNFSLIGVLILFNQKIVTYGVRLLGVFLIAKGTTLFTNLAFAQSWPINNNFISVLSSTLFLYAPYLYFFARYSATKAVLELKKDWPHFVPFAAYTLLNFLMIILPFQSIIIDYSITAAYYISSITYTFIAFKVIHKKGDNSKNQHWLKNLLLSFLLVWITFLAQVILNISGHTDTALIFKVIGVISILILANLTLAIAIYSPEIFFKGLKIIKKTTVEQSVLTEENYMQILSLMAEKELYTNPNLKLADISNALGLSERNTSLIIKNFHQGNFNDFLNSFRIEEAKRLFKEKQDELTISEVLYDVGFNSKSVFNTLFKKKVGMTPTEFKKRNSELSYTG